MIMIWVGHNLQNCPTLVPSKPPSAPTRGMPSLLGTLSQLEGFEAPRGWKLAMSSVRVGRAARGVDAGT
jgi:hypothetical protein